MTEPGGRRERSLYASRFENALKLVEVPVPEQLAERIQTAYETEAQRMLYDMNVDTASINEQIAKDCGFQSVTEMFQAYVAKEQAAEDIPIAPGIQRLFSAVEKAQTAFAGAVTAHDVNSQRNIRRTLEHVIKTVLIEDEAERTKNICELTGLIDRPEYVAKRMQIEMKEFLDLPPAERAEDEQVLIWTEIDLDDFKALNTLYGHAVVDYQILKPLAELLRQSFRETDFLCRLGGDELNIVFRNTRKDAVGILGQKIVEAIRQLPLPEPPSGHSKPEQLTGSVGLYVIDRAVASKLDISSTVLVMTEIRNPADQAAERAKSSGKDRYEIYDPTTPEAIPIFEVYVKRMLRKHENESRDMRHTKNYVALIRFEEHIVAAARVAYESKYPNS